VRFFQWTIDSNRPKHDVFIDPQDLKSEDMIENLIGDEQLKKKNRMMNYLTTRKLTELSGSGRSESLYMNVIL
jgi:hypothetical protein